MDSLERETKEREEVVVMPEHSSRPPDGGCWSDRKALSFAAVVAKGNTLSRFPEIHLATKIYGKKEGVPSIVFSTAEYQAATKRFEHSLVAKFQVGRPTLPDIRKFMLQNWKLEGRVTISSIWDDRHIIIILDSEKDTNTVLASPLRRIGYTMFRLFRWSVDLRANKEISKTTKWIRLPGLPVELFDRAFIRSITSAFATFVDIDDSTKLLSGLKFARACIEVDVQEQLPEKVWISLPDNKGFFQKVLVEGNMAYCSGCRKHGHSIEDCRKGGTNRSNPSSAPNPQDIKRSPAVQNMMFTASKALHPTTGSMVDDSTPQEINLLPFMQQETHADGPDSISLPWKEVRYRKSGRNPHKTRRQLHRSRSAGSKRSQSESEAHSDHSKSCTGTDAAGGIPESSPSDPTGSGLLQTDDSPERFEAALNEIEVFEDQNAQPRRMKKKHKKGKKGQKSRSRKAEESEAFSVQTEPAPASEVLALNPGFALSANEEEREEEFKYNALGLVWKEKGIAALATLPTKSILKKVSDGQRCPQNEICQLEGKPFACQHTDRGLAEKELGLSLQRQTGQHSVRCEGQKAVSRAASDVCNYPPVNGTNQNNTEFPNRSRDLSFPSKSIGSVNIPGSMMDRSSDPADQIQSESFHEDELGSRHQGKNNNPSKIRNEIGSLLELLPELDLRQNKKKIDLPKHNSDIEFSSQLDQPTPTTDSKHCPKNNVL